MYNVEWIYMRVGEFFVHGEPKRERWRNLSDLDTLYRKTIAKLELTQKVKDGQS